MTIKNFSIEQGLDLDGLVLTNGNGELLVNGNAISVDADSIANSIANGSLQFSWNAQDGLKLADYISIGNQNATNAAIVMLSGDPQGTTDFHVTHYQRAKAWEVAAGTTKTESTAYGSGETLIRLVTAGGTGSRISKLVHTNDGNGNFGYAEYGIIEVGNTIPATVTMSILNGLVHYSIENTSVSDNIYVTTSEIAMGSVNLPAGAGGAGGGK